MCISQCFLTFCIKLLKIVFLLDECLSFNVYRLARALEGQNVSCAFAAAVIPSL